MSHWKVLNMIHPDLPSLFILVSDPLEKALSTVIGPIGGRRITHGHRTGRRFIDQGVLWRSGRRSCGGTRVARTHPPRLGHVEGPELGPWDVVHLG